MKKARKELEFEQLKSRRGSMQQRSKEDKIIQGISLPFPRHLQAVGPVILGKTRGTRCFVNDEASHAIALYVLLHGAETEQHLPLGCVPPFPRPGQGQAKLVICNLSLSAFDALGLNLGYSLLYPRTSRRSGKPILPKNAQCIKYRARVSLPHGPRA